MGPGRARVDDVRCLASGSDTDGFKFCRFERQFAGNARSIILSTQLNILVEEIGNANSGIS